MSLLESQSLRLGIDLGGTKIEGLILAGDGRELARLRVAAPHGEYDETVRAMRDLVLALEDAAGGSASIGIGMPGSISPQSGLVQNANSTWLNGKAFARDVETALRRPVRFANDANCFALSEATDGAGAGLGTVFGVILGTGCGGGIVRKGEIIDGPRGIGGEWGHNPLPWASDGEHPGPLCWCGRNGCMETWVSGPGLAADHARRTGETLTADTLAERALNGDGQAKLSLDAHASRLARGLAAVANIIDPDCIVLGGGLSKVLSLYEVLPELIAPHLFADSRSMIVLPPKWGDASGVRGAAWLWPVTEDPVT